MKLIGIFQGKQTKHNTQILNILYDNGPLTAWQITGRISPRSKVSTHPTINKRLRSLEKKGYLRKADKNWCLNFKGLIAAILIQKTPRPLSKKWAEIIDFYAKYLKEHVKEISDTTVQINGVTYRPFEALEKTVQTLNSFNDWIALSDFVKNLVQTGVINFDVISSETLFNVIMMEFSHIATIEQLEGFLKDWDFRINDKGKVDE